MRRIGLLCLLASVSLADHIVEVSTTQFVGSQVDIAAVAVGKDYLPSILSQRVQGNGHWRSVSLGLANLDQGKLDGPALAMDRYGGGIIYVWLEAAELRAMEIAYEGRRTRPTDHGALPVGHLASPRVLSVASLRSGPLLVVAHADGLVLGAVKPRGRGRADAIATRGDLVAATQAFVPVRDATIFVVGPGRLLQLVQEGEAMKLAAEHRLEPDGFVPHAIAGEGRDLWVAGELGGRATLLRLDARNPAAAGVRVDLGVGVAAKARFLDAKELAVAGTKDGRAWVGTVSLGPRPALVHEAFVKGTAVAALGVNPARRGWSLAVATPDGTVSVLRLPADPALPRDWDPFAVPAPPEPPHVPAPAPQPPPEAQPAEEIPPVEAGGGPRAPFAVLPRAQAQRGGAVDTEIILVNLGQQRMQVVVRFVPDEGRGTFTRVTIEPGRRAKVSAADTLFRRRWGGGSAGDFDGYVRIDGGGRDDLVVDAVIRRQGEPPEDVRPHWR